MLLSLMDDPNRIAVQGKVVWITPEGVQGNRTQGIGVQFTQDETGARREGDDRENPRRDARVDAPDAHDVVRAGSSVSWLPCSSIRTAISIFPSCAPTCRGCSTRCGEPASRMRSASRSRCSPIGPPCMRWPRPCESLRQRSACIPTTRIRRSPRSKCWCEGARSPRSSRSARQVSTITGSTAISSGSANGFAPTSAPRAKPDSRS